MPIPLPFRLIFQLEKTGGKWISLVTMTGPIPLFLYGFLPQRNIKLWQQHFRRGWDAARELVSSRCVLGRAALIFSAFRNAWAQVPLIELRREESLKVWF
jgi:hypothetical protein